MSDKKIKIIFFVLLLIFVSVRFFGIPVSYHQDELRIALDIDKPYVWYATNSYGHGPLMNFIYSVSGIFFGSAQMRLFPLLFSIFNFLLLFLLVKKLFGPKSALWSLALYTVSYFSVLASLMIDVDGAVLPFFFLLSLAAFSKWRFLEGDTASWRWLTITLLALAAGFMVKFSFILAMGVLGVEVFYRIWDKGNKKLIIKYGLGAVLLLSAMVLILLNTHRVIPDYSIQDAIIHARGFIKFSGRNHFQTIVQTTKALFFASPILIAPLVFIKKEDAYKLRIFITFLVLGLIFYLVLFDFSLGALDKYLQFIIVPLSIIGGVSLSRIFANSEFKKFPSSIIVGVVAACLLFATQFVGHFVPPLWPKSEWINRVIEFRWNFLMPFTGGSGPVGFYVSWLYIALNWIIVAILVVWSFFKNRRRESLLAIVIVLSVGYNTVFIEEYLFGRINGNVTNLINRAVAFIDKDPHIDKVVKYNNIAGYELAKIHKNDRRLYVAPKYEPFNREEMSKFSGHYLVIDMPRLDQSGFYVKYFSLCDVVYKDFSQKITATIYDCEHVKVSQVLSQ